MASDVSAEPTRLPFTVGIEMELEVLDPKLQLAKGQELLTMWEAMMRNAEKSMRKLGRDTKALPPFVKDKLLGIDVKAKIRHGKSLNYITVSYRLMGEAIEIDSFGPDPNVGQVTWILELVTPPCESLEELGWWAKTLYSVATSALPKGFFIVPLGICPSEKEYTSGVTFGDHVHIGIANPEDKINVYNMIRAYIPHIIALTTNSPILGEKPKGTVELRTEKDRTTIIAKDCIRSLRLKLNTGQMGPVDKEHYIPFLAKADHAKFSSVVMREPPEDRYVDLFPFTAYGTVELRCIDSQPSIARRLALVAFLQALAAKAMKLKNEGKRPPAVRSTILLSNREKAVDYGLLGKFFPDPELDPYWAELYNMDATTGKPYGKMFQAVIGCLRMISDVIQEYDLGSWIAPFTASIAGTEKLVGPVTPADLVLYLYAKNSSTPKWIGALHKLTEPAGIDYLRDPLFEGWGKSLPFELPATPISSALAAGPGVLTDGKLSATAGLPEGIPTVSPSVTAHRLKLNASMTVKEKIVLPGQQVPYELTFQNVREEQPITIVTKLCTLDEKGETVVQTAMSRNRLTPPKTTLRSEEVPSLISPVGLFQGRKRCFLQLTLKNEQGREIFDFSGTPFTVYGTPEIILTPKAKPRRIWPETEERVFAYELQNKTPNFSGSFEILFSVQDAKTHTIDSQKSTITLEKNGKEQFAFQLTPNSAMVREKVTKIKLSIAYNNRVLTDHGYQFQIGSPAKPSKPLKEQKPAAPVSKIKVTTTLASAPSVPKPPTPTAPLPAPPEISPAVSPAKPSVTPPTSKPKVRPEKKPEVRPEKKPEKKPEVKPEKKPEVKPEKKPEVKPEKKPEVRPEKKPEVKPEKKPEVKPEKKPEVKPEKKPEVKPEKKPEVKPEKKPEVKPEKKPKKKPAPVPAAPPAPIPTRPGITPPAPPAPQPLRSGVTPLPPLPQEPTLRQGMIPESFATGAIEHKPLAPLVGQSFPAGPVAALPALRAPPVTRRTPTVGTLPTGETLVNLDLVMPGREMKADQDITLKFNVTLRPDATGPQANLVYNLYHVNLNGGKPAQRTLLEKRKLENLTPGKPKEFKVKFRLPEEVPKTNPFSVEVTVTKAGIQVAKKLSSPIEVRALSPKKQLSIREITTEPSMAIAGSRIIAVVGIQAKHVLDPVPIEIRMGLHDPGFGTALLETRHKREIPSDGIWRFPIPFDLKVAKDGGFGTGMDFGKISSYHFQVEVINPADGIELITKRVELKIRHVPADKFIEVITMMDKVNVRIDEPIKYSFRFRSTFEEPVVGTVEFGFEATDRGWIAAGKARMTLRPGEWVEQGGETDLPLSLVDRQIYPAVRLDFRTPAGSWKSVTLADRPITIEHTTRPLMAIQLEAHPSQIQPGQDVNLKLVAVRNVEREMFVLLFAEYHTERRQLRRFKIKKNRFAETIRFHSPIPPKGEAERILLYAEVTEREDLLPADLFDRNHTSVQILARNPATGEP